MAQALHIVDTSGTSDIYGQVDITEQDVWIGLDIVFIAGLPPSNGNATGALAAVSDDGSLWGGGGFLIGKNSGIVKWANSYSIPSFTGTVEAGQWYHIDYHYAAGSPVTEELFVDGVDQGLSTLATDTGTVDAVTFGPVFPEGWETALELYMKNLTIGTTMGDDDIWTTSLADLSDFDFTDDGGETLEAVPEPTLPVRGAITLPLSLTIQTISSGSGRSAITVTEVEREGVAQPVQVEADATNHHFVPGAADGRTMLEIESTDAGSETVEVLPNPLLSEDGLVIEPETITVPAGDVVVAGPFRQTTFRQNLSNDLWIDVSTSDTLFIRAYRLPLPL